MLLFARVVEWKTVFSFGSRVVLVSSKRVGRVLPEIPKEVQDSAERPICILPSLRITGHDFDKFTPANAET